MYEASLCLLHVRCLFGHHRGRRTDVCPWDEVYADASLSYLLPAAVSFCDQTIVSWATRQLRRKRGPSARGCDPMRTLQLHLS